MRIRDTDKRTREMEMLQEATGEATKSKAYDTAVRYYLYMRGNNAAAPTGAVPELMELAIQEGSVTPEQIADVLNVKEFPVEYDQEWSVGRK